MKRCGALILAVAAVLSVGFRDSRTEAAETRDRQPAAVELPQNLNFYLDPENEYGRGQIYSDKYRIRNAGKEPLTFSMEMTLSVLEEKASIAFLPEEWEKEPADRSIYMYAVLESSQGEERYVLTDPENPCEESIILQPAGTEGDSFYISFGGRLSPSEDWKSGELAVRSIYALSAGTGEYPVETTGEHIRIEDVKAAGEKKIELFIVPEEGYSLPAEIRVTVEELEVEASYDAVTGKVVLANTAGTIVIHADGITKAVLPDAEMLDEEKSIWSWTAQEGVQAYEYSFCHGEETVKKGRVNIVQGTVSWDWSEGLEEGEYQLTLKAIGDAVHCLNSEEAVYPVTVNRERMQPPEAGETPLPEASQPSEGVGVSMPEASQPSEGVETPVPESSQPSDEGEASEPVSSQSVEVGEASEPGASQPSEGGRVSMPEASRSLDEGKLSLPEDSRSLEEEEPLLPEFSQPLEGGENSLPEEEKTSP